MKFSIHLCWIWFLMTILLSGGIAQISNFPNPPILFDPPMSPRIANYEINVRLIPEDRRLEGQQILTWRNTSDDEISELQFHLYLNAFRNSKSTFMIESGGVHRGFQLSEEGWGYIELNEIFLLPEPNSDLTHPMLPRLLAEETIKGEDLLPTMEYIHPDNPEHIHDKTVIRLQLPRPLAPGESISLFFDFTAKLPEPPFARTGAKEEYFFVGQWFPKIGVYTDTGWNCHQFHRNSEFFADYGVYNVWITVPAENILGATGLPVSDPIINDDGTATHFYHAEDVHDFAWTTSPEYVEFTGKVQDVDIRVLMQPDHKDQGPRHIAAAKVAISHFQDWYGDYPFPNLTVVDPRRGAKGSGGMEYPTLITAGTIYGIPEGIRPVEMVIIHEFGHNYWYHLLASNEFEESWMDEGINTYTEIQIMNDAYGPVGDMFDFLGIRLNDLQLNRMQYLSGPDYDPVLKKAWEFYSSRSYGINSYARPGITLTTLQNYLGWDKMLEIMRTYVKRWRFKHPTSQDFVNIVNEISGEDLTDFFNQFLHTNRILDYSVDNIFTRELDTGKGYDFDMPIDTLTSNIDTSKVFSTHDSDSTNDTLNDTITKQEETKLYYSGVNLRRLGDFIFPVELEVTFENGEVIREKWDGKDLWKKYRYIKPTRLVSATIDPENKIILDVNYTNNSKTLHPSSLGVNKLSVRSLFWSQFFMEQPEIINWLIFMF